MQQSAQGDPASAVKASSKGLLWLVAGLALAAVAASAVLIFRPELAARTILIALGGLSAITAMAALFALFRSAPRAEPVFAPAMPQPEPAVPAAMLRELASLRAVQGELVAAKQEAEAATMAKGEFLATMSHEIRTPLNGIVPLLDLLRSTPLRADQRDYLATAHQSALELLRIVDDILDYSKLEASKLELENVGLNLKDLVDSVATLMGGSATAKGLRLGVVLDPAVRLAVRGDPVRLRQVLTNLVSNAIKFTEAGAVSIRAQVEDGSFVVAVTDTGVGIAEEDRERIFEEFQQVDSSSTRKKGGTGLGLAIARRIVELHGGRIWVESAPGRGSTFAFTLPLTVAQQEAAA